MSICAQLLCETHLTGVAGVWQSKSGHCKYGHTESMQQKVNDKFQTCDTIIKKKENKNKEETSEIEMRRRAVYGWAWQ